MSRRAIVACLVALGGLSIAANVVLLRAARDRYLEVQLARLDPLGLESKPPRPGGTEGQVVLYGDSRVEDWPAPEVPGCTFVNRGNAGQSSGQLALRYAYDVAPLRPKVLVFEGCVNDFKAIGAPGVGAAEAVASCAANVRQVVRAASDQGAVVLVATVLPVGRSPLLRRLVWSRDVPLAIEQANARLRALSGPGVTTWEAGALLADSTGGLRPEFARDEVHVNDAAYGVLNEDLVRVLAALRACSTGDPGGGTE